MLRFIREFFSPSINRKDWPMLLEIQLARSLSASIFGNGRENGHSKLYASFVERSKKIDSIKQIFYLNYLTISFFLSLSFDISSLYFVNFIIHRLLVIYNTTSSYKFTFTFVLLWIYVTLGLPIKRTFNLISPCEAIRNAHGWLMTYIYLKSRHFLFFISLLSTIESTTFDQ